MHLCLYGIFVIIVSMNLDRKLYRKSICIKVHSKYRLQLVCMVHMCAAHLEGWCAASLEGLCAAPIEGSRQ